MKHLLSSTILILSIINCMGQIVVEFPFNEEEQKIQFQRVVVVQGQTSEELFVKMRLWAVRAFEYSEIAIQYEDIEQGIIGGNGVLQVKTKGMIGEIKSTVEFNFKLEAKDGRIRYTFEDFIHSGKPDYPINHGRLESFYFEQKGLYRKNLTAILEQTKAIVEFQINELESSIVEEDDDW